VANIVAVFLGSGLGAVLRWICQMRLNPEQGWPLGTFLVNMVGALLAGGCLAASERFSPETRLFVVTGVLGGLTTFSALSAEMIALGFDGFVMHAFLHGLGSLLIGAIVCWLGYWIVTALGFS
jgi:fluoride exporter